VFTFGTRLPVKSGNSPSFIVSVGNICEIKTGWNFVVYKSILPLKNRTDLSGKRLNRFHFNLFRTKQQNSNFHSFCEKYLRKRDRISLK